MKEKSEISVIIPAYNEEQALPALLDKLVGMFKREERSVEVVIVDDGSTDGTGLTADRLAAEYGDMVRSLHHIVNKGKSLALRTGFENSLGQIVVMLDADMQYDPEELPKFLALIKNGYDVVNGWRDFSKYPLQKRVSSKIYNFLVRRLIGNSGHDCNCGFKVFRREVLERIELRKGLHRYVAAIASNMGYKVGEVKVKLYPRKGGEMKYGTGRLLYGLMDLIALKLRFLFLERPIMLFGLSGLLSVGLGVLIMVYLLFSSLLYNVPFHFRPLTLASIFLIVMGIQFFSLGLLAEAISTLREDVQSLNKSLHEGGK